MSIATFFKRSHKPTHINMAKDTHKKKKKKKKRNYKSNL